MSLPTPFWVQRFALFLVAAIAAQAMPTTNKVLAVRAERAFTQAQREFATNSLNPTNAWNLGRVSYNWAEFSTNMEQRAAVARVGIAACRHLLERDPKSARAHYYLGMDLGQLAEAEAPSLSAYRSIKDIEHEFKTAADLDERLDFAGPVRCLGLLYRDAPGWPISIGNKHKAREYLDRAAKLAPDYPENYLNLVESHVRWGQQGEAEKAWRKLAIVWPAAQTNLAGEAWEWTWEDWTLRRTAVKADFQKAFKQNLTP